MTFLERLFERLLICWHILTKKNYVFFAIDNDAVIFDDDGKYSHLNTNKVAEFDYFDEKFNLDSISGIKNIGWFIWKSIAVFAEQRVLKE